MTHLKPGTLEHASFFVDEEQLENVPASMNASRDESLILLLETRDILLQTVKECLRIAIEKRDHSQIILYCAAHSVLGLEKEGISLLLDDFLDALKVQVQKDIQKANMYTKYDKQLNQTAETDDPQKEPLYMKHTISFSTVYVRLSQYAEKMYNQMCSIVLQQFRKKDGILEIQNRLTTEYDALATEILGLFNTQIPLGTICTEITTPHSPEIGSPNHSPAEIDSILTEIAQIGTTTDFFILFMTDQHHSALKMFQLPRSDSLFLEYLNHCRHVQISSEILSYYPSLQHYHLTSATRRFRELLTTPSFDPFGTGSQSSPPPLGTTTISLVPDCIELFNRTLQRVMAIGNVNCLSQTLSSFDVVFNDPVLSTLTGQLSQCRASLTQTDKKTFSVTMNLSSVDSSNISAVKTPTRISSISPSSSPTPPSLQSPPSHSPDPLPSQPHRQAQSGGMMGFLSNPIKGLLSRGQKLLEADNPTTSMSSFTPSLPSLDLSRLQITPNTAPALFDAASPSSTTLCYPYTSSRQQFPFPSLASFFKSSQKAPNEQYLETFTITNFVSITQDKPPQNPLRWPEEERWKVRIGAGSAGLCVCLNSLDLFLKSIVDLKSQSEIEIKDILDEKYDTQNPEEESEDIVASNERKKTQDLEKISTSFFSWKVTMDAVAKSISKTVQFHIGLINRFFTPVLTALTSANFDIRNENSSSQSSSSTSPYISIFLEFCRNYISPLSTSLTKRIFVSIVDSFMLNSFVPSVIHIISTKAFTIQGGFRFEMDVRNLHHSLPFDLQTPNFIGFIQPLIQMAKWYSVETLSEASSLFSQYESTKTGLLSAGDVKKLLLQRVDLSSQAIHQLPLT